MKDFNQQIENGTIMAFYNPNSSLWYINSVFGGGGYTMIPNVGANWDPSAVIFLGKIYCFHQGGDSGLWYITSNDGITWSGDTNVPGVGMSQSPSAVVFQNKLFVFHASGDESTLWYTYTSDGVNWSQDFNIPNVGSSASPSAVIFQNKLYCIHQGAGRDASLWYVSSNDGVNWSQDTNIGGVSLWGSPSAIATDSALYCYHMGGNNQTGSDNQIWYVCSSDGENWSADTNIANGSGADNCPSAFFCDGTFYILFQMGTYAAPTVWSITSQDGVQWNAPVCVANLLIGMPSMIAYQRP